MNKSIIGNNKQRRKPANLTDRILDEAKNNQSRANPKNAKRPSFESSPKTSKNSIKYRIGGVPSLNLTQMTGTSVQVNSQENYDCLMQVYDVGNWIWGSRSGPTARNVFEGEQIFVSAECIFGYNAGSMPLQLISLDDFYKKQGITSEMIVEINKWFDKNAPLRASKGDQK